MKSTTKEAAHLQQIGRADNWSVSVFSCELTLIVNAPCDANEQHAANNPFLRKGGADDGSQPVSKYYAEEYNNGDCKPGELPFPHHATATAEIMLPRNRTHLPVSEVHRSPPRIIINTNRATSTVTASPIHVPCRLNCAGVGSRQRGQIAPRTGQLVLRRFINK